ncbi:helix-turn-helix domain-containing protein [Edaphobacter aggregans]|uniref:helix-turn-helix domain-containing protein n=1 Tax=Edaphobacter aggregans TaxID=570835 RepID=UPI00068F6290|nr:AraC family transcriptional regulator [Edaphobacter aggregans]
MTEVHPIEHNRVPSSSKVVRSFVQIAEIEVSPGVWEIPASSEVSLGLSLSDTSATWFESATLRNGTVAAGNTSICRVEESRKFEIKSDAKFALFFLRPEAFAQDEGASRNIQPHDLLEDGSLRALLGVLLTEQRSHFESGLLFLDSMTKTLAEYLRSRYSTMLSTRSHKGGLGRSALRRCIDYIDAHIHHDLRLEDLARESGVSTSHLIRSFRTSTGKTPYQFVLERRVEQAKGMMHDSRLGLTEIALATGFANQHHLSRVFRKTAGLTPSQFRLALR